MPCVHWGRLGMIALSGVIGKLQNADPDVRRAAIEFVGSHAQAAGEAVPALKSLLADPSPKIKTIAAQTLGKLGKAAQPALASLSSLLGAEQAEVREAAATALGGLELDAPLLRASLAKALSDDKTEVRRAATRAIQRLGPQGAIFVPDIILLAEKSENLRSVERMLRRFERTGPDERLDTGIDQAPGEQERERASPGDQVPGSGRPERPGCPTRTRATAYRPQRRSSQSSRRRHRADQEKRG